MSYKITVLLVVAIMIVSIPIAYKLATNYSQRPETIEVFENKEVSKEVIPPAHVPVLPAQVPTTTNTRSTTTVSTQKPMSSAVPVKKPAALINQNGTEKPYEWINLQLKSEDALGILVYNVEFLSASSSEGLLADYINGGDARGLTDQRFFSNTLDRGHLSYLTDEISFEPGFAYKKDNVLSFRLQAFGTSPSKVKLTNIKVGLIDKNIVDQMHQVEMQENRATTAEERNKNQLKWQDLFAKMYKMVDLKDVFTGQLGTSAGTYPDISNGIYLEAAPIKKK